MFRKFLLPLLAVIGFGFAVWMVIRGNEPVPAAPPAAAPSVAPFHNFIAGAGIVEPLSENIDIGNVVPGIVKAIYVKVGDEVKKGQPLWLIDDRDLQADLTVKRADVESKSAVVKSKQALLASAQVKYDKLKESPAPEEISPYQARVDEKLHGLQDAQDQLSLLQAINDKRAISQDDLNQRTRAVEIAEAKLRESQANLALLKAGTWQPDLKVAQADIQSAASDVASAQADVTAAQAAVDSDLELIGRLTVTAPINGQLLQIKVRLGEYAPAGVLATPLMMIGDVSQLVVRTDVDENDAWRVPRDPGNQYNAVANVRGNRDISVNLKFYRIEPYVIPKLSLTGDSTERVDTRVLQVLYQFDPGDKPIYVGQQMDVYIEAAPSQSTTGTKSAK